MRYEYGRRSQVLALQRPHRSAEKVGKAQRGLAALLLQNVAVDPQGEGRVGVSESIDNHFDGYGAAKGELMIGFSITTWRDHHARSLPSPTLLPA